MSTTAVLAFHDGVTFGLTVQKESCWLQIEDPKPSSARVNVFLRSSADMSDLAAQLREAANTLDTAAVDAFEAAS